MKIRLGLSFVLCFVLMIFPRDALAHQPNYEGEKYFVYAENPWISKAFYGYLVGKPVVYEINSKDSFVLYVNILLPESLNSRKDMAFEIFDDKGVSLYVGRTNIWTKYYEKFARDNYLKGSEFEKRVEAGTYYVVISNVDNQGKYALAIGKEEHFPPKVLINLFPELIMIKTLFFNKPWYSAFLNVFGTTLLGLFVVLIGLVLVFGKKRRKKV